MKRLFAVLAMALFLVGCNPPPSEGTIIAKEHQDATWTMYFITVYCGKGCFTMVPQYIYDDEDWILILENDEREWSLYVSEEEYNSVRVGQYLGGLEAAQFHDVNREITEEEYEANS